MSYVRAAQAYRRVQETSPARVMNALFERLDRDLNEAHEHIETMNVVAKGQVIDHALLILGEFEAALDDRRAPELCEQLRELYAFARQQILTASVTLNVKPLNEARTVLGTLRESFQKASGGVV